MQWFIVMLLVTLLLSGEIAPFLIVLCVALVWRLAQKPMEKPPARRGPPVKLPELSAREVFDLLVLRQELARLQRSGALDESRSARLLEQVDSVLRRGLGRSPPEPGSPVAEAHCERAWLLLDRHAAHPLGTPPWIKGASGGEAMQEKKPAEKPAPVHPPKGAAVAEKRQAHAVSRSEMIAGKPPTPPVRPESPPVPEKPPSAPPPKTPAAEPPLRPAIVEPPPAAPSPPPAPAPAEDVSARARKPSPKPDAVRPAAEAEAETYTWRPAQPSKLEQALQAVSGWHRLLIPFLVQNLGWFIGGLCFVGGSIFLVTYTSGFGKGLTVFAVLSVYSLLFIWGGYHLRRRRPELVLSSGALLTLGVLMIPLTFAAAARLLVASHGQVVLVAAASTAAGLAGAGFYFAVRIASGVMERALPHQHAGLFLGLAAAQLALPVVDRLPHWSVLAVLHLVLLALLAWALVLFSTRWIRSVLVERRKTAYYAAGILVFSALVSFLHLTWGTAETIPLPGGYSGPFLMLLCCVLFYVDAELKHWTQGHPVLSRFSFLLYGLSVLALGLSSEQTATTLLTLLPAIVLFAFVVWHYLTLVPLYLLLGCGFWLYHQVLLQFLPPDTYLLASLPGLFGLEWINRWALRRRSPALALVVYRTLAVSLLALTAWSLFQSEPGVTAFATALAATGLVYLALGDAPSLLLAPIPEDPSAIDWEHRTDLREGPWFYAIPVMAAVTVAYAPLGFGLAWHAQTALGLLALSAVWARLGIVRWRCARSADRAKIEVRLNSALVGLVLAAVLAWQTPRLLQILILAASGGLWFWLGLNLSQRVMIYAALLLWGIGAARADLGFLGAAAQGVLDMLAYMAVWGWLWHLRRGAGIAAGLGLGEQDAQSDVRAMLLACIPIGAGGRRYRLLKLPLQQALVVLWALGFAQLLIAKPPIDLVWGLAAACAVPATLLLAGEFRRLELLVLAALLAVIALVAVVHVAVGATPAGLLFTAVAASVGLWHVTLASLAQPLTRRLIGLLCLEGKYGPSGGRALTEQTMRWTVFAIAVGSAWYLAILAPPQGNDLQSSPFAVAAWLGCGYFWWHSGRRHGSVGHTYLTLAALGITMLLVYAWLHEGARIGALVSDPGLGILLGFVGLTLWAVARVLDLAAPGDSSADFESSLYRKPLRIAAVLFALASLLQQAALAPAGITPPSAFALGLAASVLLAAGHPLHRFPLDLTALLGLGLTLLWTQSLLLHDGGFSLWPADRRFSDLWPTLGLLAVACHRLRRHAAIGARYGNALATAATLGFGWALVGTVLLFASAPLSGDGYVPLSFLVLTLGLLPLLGPSPLASSIRGAAVPLLATLLVIGLTGAVGLAEALRFIAVLWAYVLLATAAFVLPRSNARWPHFAIAPAPWPWIGFGTALAALPPDWETPFVCAAVYYALFFWAAIARRQDTASRDAAAAPARRALDESMAHLAAFFVTLAGSSLAVSRVAPFQPNQGVSVAVWLTLAGSGLFLWLAGLHHRRALHSYVLSFLVAVAALLAYARIRGGADLGDLAADSGTGLVVALTGAALWVVARRADARAGTEADFGQSLYRRPLREAAAAVALAAMLQPLILGPDGIEPGDAVTLGVATSVMLVAGHALSRFALDLAAFLGLALTVLWVQSLWVHGGAFVLWPVSHRFSDLWPTLGLMALVLHGMGQHLPWRGRYGSPLTAASVLCYGWGLIGTLFLFALAPLAGDPFLPWSFLILAVALPPLLQGLEAAFQARGLGMPLLLSGLWISIVAAAGLSPWLSALSMAWAFVLWELAVLAVPRFNARYPRYAIDPAASPWIGLVFFTVAFGEALYAMPAGTLASPTSPLLLPVSPSLLSLSTVFWGAAEPLGKAWRAAHLDVMLFAAALYSLLMMRQVHGRLFPSAGSLALLFAGVAAIVERVPPVLGDIDEAAAMATVVGLMLVWSNVLLPNAALWRRFAPKSLAFPGWVAADLAGPLWRWPLLVMVQPLLALAALEGLNMPPIGAGIPNLPLPLLALLVLSLFHAFWLRRNALRAHLLIAAFFLSALSAGSAWFALPLLLALWSFTLTALRRLAAFASWGRDGALQKALGLWLQASPVLALASLVWLETQPAEELLALCLLAASATALGLQVGQRVWLYGALALVVALLHRWPLHWLPAANPLELLPWYALQLAAAAWLFEALRALAPADELTGSFLRKTLLPALASLAVIEWLWHEWLLWRSIASPAWLFSPWDAVAALVAGLSLLGFGIRWIRRTPDSPTVYGLVLLAAAVGLYARLLVLGDAPMGVWDTALLMAGAYLLLAMQNFIQSPPLRVAGLLLPLAALLSVPMQLGSVHASTSLLAIGVLYLLMRRQSGRPLPLYLALLAFNAAVYLWVPDWAARSQLLQVYVAPAAVTVLILLHLHRRELKAHVLNGVRLAAASTLYACVTLDVFLTPELGVFVLAVALSLAGVGLGTALRIRAFLYAGTSFLVLNVLGQVLQLYPEQRLGKAIFLMALGAAIIAFMIWFNVQREKIMQTIRVFRADLAAWE